MTKRARATIAALTFTAALGAGAGPAAASHQAPNLPVSVEPCQSDLGPNYPSCLPDLRVVNGPGSTARIDIDTNVDLVCETDSCKFVTTTCVELPGVKTYCSTTRT